MKNRKIIAAVLVMLSLLIGMTFVGAADTATAPKLVEDQIFELENASHSGMTTRKVKSIHASGGEYIVNDAAGIADKKDIIVDDLSVTFNLAKGGEIRMFVRLQVPMNAEGSFFYRWDDEEWKDQVCFASKDFQWIEVPAKFLTDGQHKFSIARKSTGILYDAVYMTRDPEFVPAVPEGVEPITDAARVIAHYQESIPEFDYRGGVIDMEDMTYEDGMTLVEDAKASGKTAMKVIMPNQASSMSAPNASEPGTVEFEFTATENCGYSIWMRSFAKDGGSDSCYVQVEGKTQYMQMNLPYHGRWTWKQVVARFEAKAGETYKFKFYFREKNFLIDQFVITGIMGYAPVGEQQTGIEAEIVTELKENTAGVLEQFYDMPPYNPPAGVHPRVYFTKEDIPSLIEKLNDPINAPLKKIFDGYIADHSGAGSAYNGAAQLEKMEAKAYYYALFGDKEVGREAINLSLESMRTWPFLSDIEGNTRTNGWFIATWSKVYDWCYDLLTEEEKAFFITRCEQSASVMEVGWPPVKQPEMLWGHGAEAQVHRDLLCFAIATYDERPDIWNNVAGEIYQLSVPARKFMHQGGLNLAGVSYGTYRYIWECHAYLLLTAMGLPEPWPGEDVAWALRSHSIYFRRPDGTWFMNGDTPNLYNVPMSYSYGQQAATLLAAVISDDPYLMDQYYRITNIADKEGYEHQRAEKDELTLTDALIFFDPSLIPKSISNLPQSMYVPSPSGMMLARTGWDDGVQSNVAVAFMKMEEYYVGGHQTPAAGHFSIYYKGPLTNQSGIYDIMFSPGFQHYNHHSIASNCILVYDPNEDPANFQYTPNDGGQKWAPDDSGIPGIDLSPSLDTPDFEGDWWLDDAFKRTTTEGVEIDPKNPITPDYSYLKGDITKWYSDKVKDYHRSMIFLDLKDDTIPAAMVVFDKLSVKNPTHKKTWVLHGQTVPQIIGGRTIWGSSPFKNSVGEEYTGSMVHDIILPAPSDLNKEVIGSEEEGWNIVNGVNVPNNTAGGAALEENTYRLELSPKANNETELFLNVIQVTDRSNKAYHAVTKVENTTHVGVKISDRVVLFSKDAKRVGTSFEVNAIGSGSVKYTICDMQAGVWNVTNGGKTFEVVVTEEGGVLAFDGVMGNVKAVPAGKGAPVVEEVPLVLSDDRALRVKIGNSFAYMPVEPDIVNGSLVVPIEYIAPKMNLKRQADFMKEVFVEDRQKITAEVRPDATTFLVNGEVRDLNVPTYMKDGYLMVELRTFAEAFNYLVYWDNFAKTANLVSNPVIVKEDDKNYAKVVNVITDEIGVSDPTTGGGRFAVDGDLETLWSANAAEGPVGFIMELEEETLLENIEIVFNPNSFRTPYFDVYVSQDGVNFTHILNAIGSPDANGFDYETFAFDPQIEVYAKYVQYLANGSDKSKWNGVKEIRFKVGEPIKRWETTENHAVISKVQGDGGETDPANTPPNIADNNGRTIWAAQGVGRYVTFALEDETDLVGVEIIFNKNSNRIPKFEIHVSDDGENFRKIYGSAGNPEAGQFEWESFNFGNPVSAKYVRYVAMGSNLSAWNGVVEVRFLKK